MECEEYIDYIKTFIITFLRKARLGCNSRDENIQSKQISCEDPK